MKKVLALLWLFCALSGYAQTRTEREAFNYYMSGVKNYNMGKYDTAIADLAQAIRLDPRNADYYYWRGHAYLNRAYPHKLDGDAYWQDDWNRAVADIEAALRLDPNNADARRKLEYAQEAAGDRLYPPPVPPGFDWNEVDPGPPPPIPY
ncbi:MAG: tetratricopeptide repeat protein [Treponema sp.]|jgi:tetratricopeptide (TPR) repeat protein|nr:tetratricopeptide repeat protein [Treponema sp.]